MTKRFCEAHDIVPVSVAPRQLQQILVVAMAEPENGAALLEELELFTGMKVEVVRAEAQAIRDAIRACYGAEN